MRYKYVLLDFDGTILDYKKLERHALKKTFNELSLPINEEIIETYFNLNIKYWHLYEAGEISSEELKIGRALELFNLFDISGIEPSSFNALFMKNASSFAPMYEGTEASLNKLSQVSRLFLVTNGFSYTQKGKIKASGIGHLFENVFIAEEIGAKKPDHKYFEIVYDAIGRPDRREIIIVGDSLMADIKGGNDFDIDTCWFNQSGIFNDTGIIPTIEIHSLDELLILQ